MEILQNLLILAIENEIIYAFSRENLQLYRLKWRQDFAIQIGMFISFKRVEGFLMDVEKLIDIRAPNEKDCVQIENTENGPIIVLKSWMIFSQNQNLRSHKMNCGFSDWYGYIRCCYDSLRKSRNSIFVVSITVDDLKYDRKSGACLFRQHGRHVGKRQFEENYISTCEILETDLKERQALESVLDVDEIKLGPKISKNQEKILMAKTAVEYKILVLRFDLENNAIFGFNKVKRCLMVVDVENVVNREIFEDIRVGGCVNFIYLATKNGLLIPELGSVSVDKKEREDDVISVDGDYLRIQTMIAFSSNPNHFTNSKEVAFSDYYGFIDFSSYAKSKADFEYNVVYDTIIEVKQLDTSEAPIFEAVSTPKRVSNFNHVRQFMDYLHEFEAEKVEEKRRGFGSSGFDFDLGESKNRLYNPYYTKNKKTYEFVKNAVRLQYQQMVLVKKFDRDLSRVLGVCSSTFGDADLYVLGNEAGEFELEIGDWFRGILDRKKTAERLIVDKIEEKMEPAAKHRLTAKGEFVLQLEIDLRYRRRPSDFEEDGVTRKQFAIIEDNIVGKFFIDKLDWFLFGKRVHGEVIFVENSPPSSWKFHKMIEDIPDGVEFKKWLAQKSRDGDIRDQQFVPANIDGNDSDFEDDDDYDRPFVSRKAENRQNSSPNFNLNTNQNYERTSSRNSREDAGISMRSGGEHFEKPPSRSNHRFSPQNPPTSGEYVYNPQKQPGRSNHNISPQNPPTSGEYVHNSQKPTSRSNHNISPQNPPTSGEYVYNSQKARSQAGSRLDSEMTQDDLIELGIVTQQIDDREFIVFSDTRKCAVFYELIPNSTNARLGELFKFRSVRVMNPTGHYNFKVSEVIRVENLADIGNPVNIVENCAQMGVSVDLSKVDEDEARYGVFISQSNDLGRVIYGENISTPTSDCLDAKQFHDLYKNRESSRKMLCFCQFEFRRAINASHYEYQWVLKSCEGTVESYLERQRRLEMRNLGGGGQQTREYLDDDDIAQAKRRNAENLRSVQNSRNTTAVDEMYFKEPMPSSSYSAQPPPQPPQFRQNENYRFDEMPSRNESRSGEGRGGYSRNSRDDEYSRRPLQEPHQNYPEETRILTQNSSNGRGPGSTTSASGTNSADTETLRKLQRELRHLYKINDFFMKSASIRKAVKQEDGDIFDEWEDHMKRVRDLLSTTAQNKS